MTRTWKITQDHIDIIYHRAYGKSLRYIAKKQGVSEPNIHRKVKDLRNRGYLKSDNLPTPLGYSLIKNTENENVIAVEQDAHPVGDNVITFPEQTQRLHAFQVKYLLRNPATKDKLRRIASFKDFPVKTRPLRNHTDYIIDFQDFRAIITTKSIIIAGIQAELPVTEDSYTLILNAFDKADNVIEQVEKKLKKTLPWISLMRNDRGILSGEIIRLEIAHTRDPIAKNCIRDHEKIRIKDPETGRPRILVDDSGGRKEFEFVDSANALEDNEKFRQFKNDLGPEKYQKWAQDFFIDGKLDPWRDTRKIDLLEQQNAMLKKSIEQRDAELREIRELLGEMTSKFGNMHLMNQQQLSQVISFVQERTG